MKTEKPKKKKSAENRIEGRGKSYVSKAKPKTSAKPEKDARAGRKRKAEPDLEHLSFDLQKSDKGRIGVSVQEYGDGIYLDIRHFFKTKDGDWAATRKGCAVPLALSKKLVRRLKKLIEKAEEDGLEVDDS